MLGMEDLLHLSVKAFVTTNFWPFLFSITWFLAFIGNKLFNFSFFRHCFANLRHPFSLLSFSESSLNTFRAYTILVTQDNPQGTLFCFYVVWSKRYVVGRSEIDHLSKNFKKCRRQRTPIITRHNLYPVKSGLDPIDFKSETKRLTRIDNVKIST